MEQRDTRSDELLARLREQGYRVTPQRAAVLRVLTHCDDHPTVEQIHERVGVQFPMTSLATVYKTLAVFREMGAVCELRIDGEGTRYDGRRDDPHPHLMCVRCGRIMDVEIAPAADTVAKVEEKTGYRIVSHRHDYFGICPACLEPSDDEEAGQGTSDGDASESAPTSSDASGR